MYWILDKDKKTPIEVRDITEWGNWFENKENRILQQDEIDNYFVSTVFLGLDHSFSSKTPLLWETMVFDQLDKSGRLGCDMYQERYSTYDEALEGHKRACEMAKNNDFE